MEKYIRPTKTQITALALTLVLAGGGAFGVMSATNNASAQTPAVNNSSLDISDGDGEYQGEVNEPTTADISDGDGEYADESSVKGSIQVTDNNQNESATENDQSESGDAALFAGMAKITEADAMKAAEAAVGGTANKATLGNEDGSLIYEVKIGTQEVKVDAGNGTILEVESDDHNEKGGHDETAEEEIDGSETADSAE